MDSPASDFLLTPNKQYCQQAKTNQFLYMAHHKSKYTIELNNTVLRWSSAFQKPTVRNPNNLNSPCFTKRKNQIKRKGLDLIGFRYLFYFDEGGTFDIKIKTISVKVYIKK